MPDPFAAYVVPKEDHQEDPFAAYAIAQPAEQAQPPAYIRSGSKTKAILGHLLSEEPATLGALGSLSAMAAPVAGMATGTAAMLSALAPAAAQLGVRGYRAITGQSQKPVGAGEVVDVLSGPILQGAPGVIARGGRLLSRSRETQRNVGAAIGAALGHAALPGYGTLSGGLAGQRLGKILGPPIGRGMAQAKPVTEIAGRLRLVPKPQPHVTPATAVPPTPQAAAVTPGLPVSSVDTRITGLAPGAVERRVVSHVPLAGSAERRSEELARHFGGTGGTSAPAVTTPPLPTALEPFLSKSRKPIVVTMTENDVEALPQELRTALQKIREAVVVSRKSRSSTYKADAEVRKELERLMTEPD